MQFFLTSPIIIFALWKHRTIGLTLLTTLLVYSFIKRYVYRVSAKKILSELLDLALIMRACLNSLCRIAHYGKITRGIQAGTHNQCQVHQLRKYLFLGHPVDKRSS